MLLLTEENCNIICLAVLEEDVMDRDEQGKFTRVNESMICRILSQTYSHKSGFLDMARHGMLTVVVKDISEPCLQDKQCPEVARLKLDAWHLDSCDAHWQHPSRAVRT
ncbi:hypothetical protein GUITHDRAFT_112621 [Guillardia theta CCMP2712]|uniref:Uncharacterized protein n=1 Tax=Guillardia theta (strain CCMP2712) TaxID=905079 RepID=L1IZS0_GUITC|nr:hypothetical protein GUITHDRAFT_112621 [Guillardia theta CCMP2712]EKX41404.1 hypothetical protein GUITHDRAFT_112621 [Guillardia theta CCMP2712]|mmetsp:Transcript_236/g.534  ORF Transcript_236/g.534 Transcript_236/m.534 type:complete len:108 (-) Transcript_236:92-415(-)|eukprot:XP_005828384.1 hypothetical protein GUITHDRAFT_112621 [Guillardia theta CCMP2712]